MNETVVVANEVGNTAVVATGGLEQGIYSALAGVVKQLTGVVVSNEQIALALFGLSLVLFLTKWRHLGNMVTQYGTVLIVLAILFISAKSIGVI